MDWMSRLNDNVLLKDLNIPGAHNSGQVDFRVYDNKQGYNWAEAQRQAKQVASIYEMLNAGVRLGHTSERVCHIAWKRRPLWIS